VLLTESSGTALVMLKSSRYIEIYQAADAFVSVGYRFVSFSTAFACAGEDFRAPGPG
jgi:hypothetical protein